MNPLILKKILTGMLGMVWMTNGLLCKIFNLVPRHQQIVGSILGNEHALLLTKFIGFLEVLLALWVWSRIKPVYCAATQVILVLSMNILEFFLVPELLLFGKFNAVLAFFLIIVILLREFWDRHTFHLQIQ